MVDYFQQAAAVVRPVRWTRKILLTQIMSAWRMKRWRGMIIWRQSASYPAASGIWPP